MNSIQLQQLKDCCRDQEAFEKAQRLFAAQNDFAQVEQQKALFRVIIKIRESLNLETIFKITATEVRQLLQADRVAVFRFTPNSGWNDGEFVSEDVALGFSSAMAASVHDHCFGEQYAADYHRGRIQAIADIQTSTLKDCHRDVLEQFQIRANLVVPLLQDEALWGLLCIHQCAGPRHWQQDEIEFVKQIAVQLSVALQQAELLEKTRQQSADLATALETLKKAQTQLIQSEKLSVLGQLVAGIAHEINNPVNFIHGNLNHATQYAQHLMNLMMLYQKHYPHPPDELRDRANDVDLDFIMEDFPRMLSSMQLGAYRIRNIVLSLRNFSRLDEAEMKPVNIHEGLDSTLLILQYRLKPKAPAPSIVIHKEYGELPLVECYPSQLNQVFMNVLVNAIDALEELAPLGSNRCKYPQSTITIRTYLRDNDPDGIPRAVVRIADNGSGVLPQAKEHLFDAFFTTKPMGKGTGLGLSISHQIVVEKHKGILRYESLPDQGTEFWIEIPVYQSSLESALSVSRGR